MGMQSFSCGQILRIYASRSRRERELPATSLDARGTAEERKVTAALAIANLTQSSSSCSTRQKALALLLLLLLYLSLHDCPRVVFAAIN